MSNSRNTLSLVVMVILAGASWWAVTVLDPEHYQAITISQEGPDHFMEDFVSTTLGKDGSPLHRLVALRLTHFPNQEHSELQNPEMTFYKKDDSTWVASAKQGRILDDGDEIFLNGDVVIKRPGKPASAITINTQGLRILPNEDIAETADTIVMQQDNNTVTATGMFAHFEQGEVELLSEVRGWYAN